MKNPPKTARKVQEPTKPVEVSPVLPVTAETASKTDSENDDEIERIAIPIVKKTGLPAWNRMRKPEEAKKTLQQIARDPAISPAASTETAALVPLCAQGVLLLGALAQSYAAKQGYRNPEVMAITGAEAMSIGELAAAVLAKYQASIKYAEEWMLVAALAGLFTSKAMQVEKPIATAAA